MAVTNPRSTSFLDNLGASVAQTSANSNSTPAAAANPAKFWLNVGYFAAAAIDGEDAPRFISTPFGLALDTMSKIDTTSDKSKVKKNPTKLAMATAQNDLLDEMLAEAEKLEPGQYAIIGDPTDGGIVMQIRRVSEDVAPIDAANNPFTRRPLSLVPNVG